MCCNGDAVERVDVATALGLMLGFGTETSDSLPLVFVDVLLAWAVNCAEGRGVGDCVDVKVISKNIRGIDLHDSMLEQAVLAF